MTSSQVESQTLSKIVTLLTDFGDRDVYVGVMKGAIATINSQLSVIDLTHQIPPQNLFAARFALLNAYPYFPRETVHVAVVDPGVGSHRRGIALKLSQGYLVCPDNGIASGILESETILAAVELSNPQYWRVSNPSNTFHGRDIFAPVGAHLASGVALSALGQTIAQNSLIKLNLPPAERLKNKITGCIQDIDRFGNLITNIPAAWLEAKTWRVIVANITIDSGRTYSQVDVGENIAIVGSHGWLEIAVNGGNAQNRLQLNLLERICIETNF